MILYNIHWPPLLYYYPEIPELFCPPSVIKESIYYNLTLVNPYLEGIYFMIGINKWSNRVNESDQAYKLNKPISKLVYLNVIIINLLLKTLYRKLIKKYIYSMNHSYIDSF